MNVEIVLGFDDHISIYGVDAHEAEELLSIEPSRVKDAILECGIYVEHQTEGDVFFDVSGFVDEEEAVQEFQQGLFDWLNEHEFAVAV